MRDKEMLADKQSVDGQHQAHRSDVVVKRIARERGARWVERTPLPWQLGAAKVALIDHQKPVGRAADVGAVLQKPCVLMRCVLMGGSLIKRELPGLGRRAKRARLTGIMKPDALKARARPRPER